MNQKMKKMQTTYPLRVQAIRSKGQQPRLYVSFPLALAAAIGLEPGDMVQWELLDRTELHLVRLKAAPAKTRQRAATGTSSSYLPFPYHEGNTFSSTRIPPKLFSCRTH